MRGPATALRGPRWTLCSWPMLRLLRSWKPPESLGTVALQLYDDVLDIEEDLEAGKFTWTAIQALKARGTTYVADDAPDDPLALELVYKAALVEGVLVKTLQHAEAFLRRSARIAEPHFPR